jgi:hypothetical protein
VGKAPITGSIQPLVSVDCRYIVSFFEYTGAKYLCETVYCERGNAELYIKDQKVFLNPTKQAVIKQLQINLDFFYILQLTS